MKISTSFYNCCSQFYGEIKKIVDSKKYWDKKGIKGEMEEKWARLRCGNIGKGGKKGYEGEKKIGKKKKSGKN